MPSTKGLEAWAHFARIPRLSLGKVCTEQVCIQPLDTVMSIWTIIFCLILKNGRFSNSQITTRLGISRGDWSRYAGFISKLQAKLFHISYILIHISLVFFCVRIEGE